MKNYRLIITADENDGDTVVTTHEIDENKLNAIKPMVDAIKNFKPYKANDGRINWTHSHNYPTGECARRDMGEKDARELYGHVEGFDAFNNMVPYGQYGIHTIYGVDAIEITQTIQLL